MSIKKKYPVCDRCGSPNVSADAAARWDHEKQDWTITNVFDKGHSCDDCGDECRIEWEEGDYPEALAQQSAAVDEAMPILVELVATLAATGTVTGGRIYFPERQTRELLKRACAALATTAAQENDDA